jgi:hypothetical protein
MINIIIYLTITLIVVGTTLMGYVELISLK